MHEIQTLHIVNKAPDHPRFRRCLAMLAPGDTLLLIEDAVLATGLKALAADVPCLALAPDLRARGLEVSTGQRIETTDYAGMVALTAKARRVISW
ncbi:sulfurtransferase complex subunit TusB [Marinobacter lutaoensis]|jgi:tRNA 2-thiouridine synthesizing protein B|uniref:Sulfurtransferase complex subunit TusB n=1 Tax=Marinobacter lutaoensis TaxID=135739 RepID=A0A1V2DTY7_9GAMM|nr:sulfurtransferase complex subunit TusB [Marinobacter lutaoensis]MBI42750.1 sulfurtransferase complex subunit TusB [Oceanospirillales bacterium]ONF44174.1 hypothetical protein BTO32_07790 [Marinobacter lutaoensis]|tara:strand:- start:2873 stop:3157 length:285 start_codon:yes stop_codon:yes gene_type:complete